MRQQKVHLKYEDALVKITVQELQPFSFIATQWAKEMEAECDRDVFEFETFGGAAEKAFHLLAGHAKAADARAAMMFARKGGEAQTPKKAKAARENGKLGGRPAKIRPEHQTIEGRIDFGPPAEISRTEMFGRTKMIPLKREKK